MEKEFTHFDQDGNAVMVDVSEKNITDRVAIASGQIKFSQAVMDAIVGGTSKKGDVLGVARIAGIMAVKETAHLIPLCHMIQISKCSIDFEFDKEECAITATCKVRTDGKTGVEMEAMTGVSVTLLTIYDMCKAIDKKMVMTAIHLVKKTGGKSGEFNYD